MKTYYEKILITSGEVPEVGGEHETDIGFISYDKINNQWYTDARFHENGEVFKVQMYPSYFYKPVPSPKQESVDFAEWVWENSTRYKDKYLLNSIDDNYIEYTLSELYDKFKEKGEK